MKTVLLVAMCFLFASPAALASDPVGVYARVQKIQMFPNAEKPERAVVTGTFSHWRKGNQYAPPVHGVMHFKLASGKERATRAEWKDMQRIADRGLIISFGRRYKDNGKVYSLKEKVGAAHPHPVHAGMRILRPGTLYTPIRSLAYFVPPVAPGEGSTVKYGRRSLRGHRILVDDDHARYIFEIEDSTGKKEQSKPIKPGTDQPEWTPQMQLQPSQNYIWRAWVTTTNRDGKTWQGPVAATRFNVAEAQ